MKEIQIGKHFIKRNNNPVIYVDMDGVIADFDKKKRNFNKQILAGYDNRPDLIPKFFSDLEVMPGAKKAMKW